MNFIQTNHTLTGLKNTNAINKLFFLFIVLIFNYLTYIGYQYSSSLKKFIYIDYQYIMQQPMKFAQTNHTILGGLRRWEDKQTAFEHDTI